MAAARNGGVLLPEVLASNHHEAMYWAGRERAKATKLQAEIDQDPSPAGGSKPKKVLLARRLSTTLYGDRKSVV